MNKEELVKEYDELKAKALGEYLQKIADIQNKYRLTKEAMKEWYDRHKAKL